ncbi:MAG: hypothetical protein JST93_10905 [Acidobacteria bacterium]|nr:hypothetical protein [Acidobacteriota bacterium]
MSDRLTLSCWLRNFGPLSMIPQWEKLLGVFPFSKLSQRSTVLRVYAVNLSEPVIFERAYAPPFDPAEAVAISREFQHEDCAYQLECAWDLMELGEQDWQMAPVNVSLWCFGPEFDNDTTDHVRVEFGLEDTFLPSPDDDASIRASHTNLRSLMRLVDQIGAKLPVERKHLWSESGVNFAQKLQAALAGEGPSGLVLQ